MAGLKGPQGPLKAGLRSILLAFTSASSPPVATASITSTLPSTGMVGNAISFTYTSANVSTLYLAVIRNGTEVSRAALPSTSGTQGYTSAVACNEQFALYNAASGGVALYTSPIIVISAAAAPTLVLNPISGGVTSGGAFVVSGTLSNYGAQPALSVSVDGAATVAMSSTSPYKLGFLPSSGAPTGFTFTAQALSSGSHTIQVTDTTNGLSSNTISITVTAPASVGGLPAFRVQANAAMAAGNPITLGHFFTKGDLPAGTWTKLIASTTGGQTAQVQVDQTNTWLADGSLRFATLSFLSPIAFTAGQVASFQLGVGSSALAGTGFTPAQLAAGCDFKIKVSGGDFGSTVYSVSNSAPPTSSTFTTANSGAASTSGGGSSALVLSQTYSSGDNITSLLQAMSGSAQTFTAAVQVGNQVGYASAGLTLRNSSTGKIANFAVSLPGSPNFFVAGYNSFNSFNSFVVSSVSGTSYEPGILFQRIAFDGANYTFLISPTGAVNSWQQIGQVSAAAAYNPNQIGFYVNANSNGASSSGPCTLTVSDWEVASGANLQGAATASITTSIVGDTFTVGANDVLANLQQWGGGSTWGTNYPLGGWEMIRSGPICTEWRIWRYLKRDSDGASHRQVKAKLYVRAWSNGAGGIQGIEPLLGLFQENSYGPHPSATVGSISPQKYAGAVSLANGSTTVQAFTGPSGANPVTQPQRGWWGALADGSRPWVGVGGAAKPSYMVAHDVPYAIKTRCIPPYDYQAVAAQAAAGASLNIPAGEARTYTPNVSTLSYGINATGNDNNDPRYGYLSVDSAALLLNPLDQLRQQTVLAYGWSWADWNMWICDERSGWPLNTGTDSSTCPSPANPSFVMYNNGARGSPAWWTFGTSAFPGNYPQFNYGPNWDNSHTPSLWIMPLLRTGDAAFEEMALFQCSVSCAAYDQGGRNFSFGGTTYENVVLGLYQMEGAERAGANWIRQFGAASRMIRDANPMKGYVTRALSQNAACAGSGNIPYAAAALAKFGIFWALVSDTGPASKGDGVFPHVFMTSLLAFMLGIEARVGDYPGWRTLLAAMQPIFVGLYDTATGGSSYDFTLYNPTWSDGTNVYADLPIMRLQNGITGTPPSTGFRYGSSGDGGLGNTSSVPRAAIYMAGWLDQPITNAVSVAQESYTRYKATYPGQAGVINYTTFSANDGHGLCPQFAIAPPAGVS